MRAETSISTPIAATLTVLLAGLAVSACGADHKDKAVGTDLPQGSEPVHLNPADFTTRIDNPYRPMLPGSRRVYRDTDSDGTVQRVVLTVTPRTKKIANGVQARVVRETVTEDGQIAEDGVDWYAQDSAGNVWYLGELSKEYEDGKVKETSSWEAGVNGAQPGIVMPADPRPGVAYRQMYYARKQEDRGRVVSTGERVESPAGYFTDAVVIEDSSPLEPKLREFKFFARGVGLVRAFEVAGGSGREELVSYKKAS
ncbi:MAG: hypothetical protein E6G10_24810 [Actinobacteria bacterium]|nr:MAG: hypothetical protein E6G10_24810 [Actinomycetota bacterium]